LTPPLYKIALALALLQPMNFLERWDTMSNEWMIITIGISCVLAATAILILVMTVIEALSFAAIV